jgi:hypothetical protein
MAADPHGHAAGFPTNSGALQTGTVSHTDALHSITFASLATPDFPYDALPSTPYAQNSAGSLATPGQGGKGGR